MAFVFTFARPSIFSGDENHEDRFTQIRYPTELWELSQPSYLHDS